MEAFQFEKEGHVAVVTNNSPPANALSSNLLKNLDQLLNQVEADQTINVVVLKGEGRFFSAGANIKEFTGFQEASDYESLAKSGQEVFNRIENFHIPVIAAIHGAALGGGLELAMACHMRIVTENAKLGLPELTLGIIPGFAGTQRLPQYVGTAKAYEMILSGVPISGKEAVKLGLANRAVSEENLIEETMKLAHTIAEKSKLSIQEIMKLIPYAKTEQFQTGVNKEAQAFGRIFGSDDAKEGVQAFLEKRKPQFKDR